MSPYVIPPGCGLPLNRTFGPMPNPVIRPLRSLSATPNSLRSVGATPEPTGVRVSSFVGESGMSVTDTIVHVRPVPGPTVTVSCRPARASIIGAPTSLATAWRAAVSTVIVSVPAPAANPRTWPSDEVRVPTSSATLSSSNTNR